MSDIALDQTPAGPLLPIPVGRSLVVSLVAVGVFGLLGGLLWHLLTVTPAYTIGDDKGAIITESGLSQVFASDIWYIIISLVLALPLGAVCWWLFRRLGWPGVLLTVAAGLIAAVICWQFGHLLGPNGFAERVSAANPGDRVPMDLSLDAPLLVLVWPAAVGVPILVASIVDLARGHHR
ncbi:MAG: hypothetical protein FWD63_01530 [Propionibacteriaceae bacterium]|nr:hypothetical protein [Propionibacteriaceae bacterium]